MRNSAKGKPGSSSYALASDVECVTRAFTPQVTMHLDGVTADRFVARASDGTTITVFLVLEVDPSVPTYGEVKPGETGNGGPEVDVRDPAPSAPTVPSDDEDENGGPVEAR